jgi:hypothetical protein
MSNKALFTLLAVALIASWALVANLVWSIA